MSFPFFRGAGMTKIAKVGMREEKHQEKNTAQAKTKASNNIQNLLKTINSSLNAIPDFSVNSFCSIIYSKCNNIYNIIQNL